MVLTMIGVGAIVVVLAGYLITVCVLLRHVSFTVGTVLVGVRSIALQCQPIGGVVRDIVRDVQSMADDLDALVSGVEQAEDQRARSVRAG